jgi:hypothetical protein
MSSVTMTGQFWNTGFVGSITPITQGCPPHHFVIDASALGVCKKCSETRQFNPNPDSALRRAKGFNNSRTPEINLKGPVPHHGVFERS